MYDFEKDGKIQQNDWIYISSPTREAYRLLGKTPSSKDRFGWKPLARIPQDLNISNPAGIFIFIGFQKDNSAFSWIYMPRKEPLMIYKLLGASDNGNFIYYDADCDGYADPLPNIALEGKYRKILHDGISFSRKYTLSFMYTGSQPLQCDNAAQMPVQLPFPTIDINKTINNLPGETVPTIGDIGEVTLQKRDDAVTLDLSDIQYQNTQQLKVTKGVVSRSDIGKPLFVNSHFKGLITKVDMENGRVFLKNATSIEEVYKKFSIRARNTAIFKLRNTISLASIGRYDAINKEHLHAYIVTKRATTRGIFHDEPVLHIDIPKGYKIPIEMKSLHCSFWNASCQFTAQFNTHRKSDMGFDYNITSDTPLIEFSSQGSYLEIGIGAYLNAYYDYNTFGRSVFRFQTANSAKTKIHLKFKLKGNFENLSKSQLKKEIDINITKPFKVFIPTEASPEVNVFIVIQPILVLGIEGKVAGEVIYITNFGREGEIRSKYDSVTGKKEFFSTVKDIHSPMDKSGFQKVSVEAQANAYIFPNLTITPVVEAFKIDRPVSLFQLQNGIKYDNTLLGKITDNFIAQEGEKIKTQAELKGEIYGHIRGKWYIYLGDHKFYESDDYTDIVSTPKLMIFDWKVSLLGTPLPVIKEESNGNRKLFFSLNDKKMLGYVHFYYDMADNKDILHDLTAKNFRTFQEWSVGDAPIAIDGVKYCNVRAFVATKDLPNVTLWQWGGSLSPQKSFIAVGKVEPPTFVPNGGAFKDSVNVTLLQKNNLDIYYTIDGKNFHKYNFPLTIDRNSTITAYAQIIADGKIYKSQMVKTDFVKCGANEVVSNEQCVPASSSSSTASSSSSQSSSMSSSASSNQSEHAWSNWPNPQYCPMHYPHYMKKIWLNDKHSNFVNCYYHFDSLLDSEEIYINGRRNGVWKIFLHGFLYREITYQNGKQNGTEKQYYENSQALEHEINYKNDVKDGIERWLTKSGCVYHIKIYSNGNLINENFNEGCF